MLVIGPGRELPLSEPSAILQCRQEMTMLPKVYIETTIPSFYHEIRKEPDMVARRGWTRDLWDGDRARYFVVTNIPVS